MKKVLQSHGYYGYVVLFFWGLHLVYSTSETVQVARRLNGMKAHYMPDLVWHHTGNFAPGIEQLMVL
jgi:hypothetical protein